MTIASSLLIKMNKAQFDTLYKITLTPERFNKYSEEMKFLLDSGYTYRKGRFLCVTRLGLLRLAIGLHPSERVLIAAHVCLECFDEAKPVAPIKRLRPKLVGKAACIPLRASTI
jgi:hypothetical protein